MNKLLLAILFFIPLTCFCQEIKSNEVDPFTRERTIETTLVPIKEGLSNGFGISYTAIDDNYYLNIVGYGSGSTAINEGDKIWFVMEDGNVVQFNNMAEVEGESEAKNIYIHHFFAGMIEIEKLVKKNIAIVRISSADGVLTDIKLSKKNTKVLLKLNEIFFREINK